MVRTETGLLGAGMSKKPPKLPPLPKVRKLGALPRAKSGKAADLSDFAPEPDEVEESRDMYGIEMGGTEPGRWFGTTTKDGSVGGRCQKCGRKRKAENLKLTTLPFGKGEIWACKEGCR